MLQERKLCKVDVNFLKGYLRAVNQRVVDYILFPRILNNRLEICSNGA